MIVASLGHSHLIFKISTVDCFVWKTFYFTTMDLNILINGSTVKPVLRSHSKIDKTGLSRSVKYFTDRSKAVLLLWIFYACSVLCLLYLCARLFICALWSPAGKGLTSWRLSFMVYNCEFVTFPLVSWIRCGT